METTQRVEPAQVQDAPGIAALIRREEIRHFGVTDTEVRAFAAGVVDPEQFGANTALVRGGAGLLGVSRVQRRRADFTFVEGVGDAVREGLLEWAEGRQRALGRDPLRMTVVGTDPAQCALLERRGYAPERSYLRMRREFTATGPPAASPVPDGYRLRGVDLEADAETLWQVSERGFADRPDQAELPTLAAYRAEHRDFTLVAANWSFIAQAPDGAPAGGVVAWHRAGEGFIAELSVVPEHRRGGLARALITASFAAAHRDGRDSVALLVASDNPHARALYEGVGMSVRADWHDWTRAL